MRLREPQRRDVQATVRTFSIALATALTSAAHPRNGGASRREV
jgi:hypothetical protein